MNRYVMLAIAAAAGFLLQPAATEAALVSGFAGNTRPVNNDNVALQDGSVSFAVFAYDGLTAGDVFGTGLAGFDSAFVSGTGSAGLGGALGPSAGTYLYLYQIANDGTASTVIDKVTVHLNGHPNSSLSSWGWFSGTGFVDSEGLVAAGNPLGNDGPFYASPPLVRAPADTSGALPGSIVTANAGGAVPFAVTNSSGSFQVFMVDPFGGFGASVAVGGSTILVGFTSTLAPGFGNTSLQNGFSTNGTVATLAPAPSAATMLLSVLPLLLGCVVFGRRFGLVPNLQSAGVSV